MSAVVEDDAAVGGGATAVAAEDACEASIAPAAQVGEADAAASAAGTASAPRPFLKLGGISTEVHAKALCVGVGINVARPDGQLHDAPAGKNIPVYLDELGFCEGPVEQRIAAVSEALCNQLAQLYPRWCAEGLAPFQAEFDQHAALTGRFVRMEDLSGNALAAGTVVRTAADGRLVLRAADGSEIFANSGEAHIRS